MLDDLVVVLDDVMLVREHSIKVGMQMLYEHAGLVVEPSAALGVAGVLEQPERFAGRRVTTILCGSNVGLPTSHGGCWNRSHASAASTQDRSASLVTDRPSRNRIVHSTPRRVM